MRLIDAPTELGQALIQAYGDKVQSHEQSDAITMIKFRGWPWLANGTDTVQVRVLLLRLMEVLEQHGFSLYASINQDSDSDSKADTLFCTRNLNWSPGAPVYHG
jgi:hypothetical protein